MTELTTIQVFQKATELGLNLGVRPSNKLTVQPIEVCPKDLETLRAHKWHLLSMLSWPFVMAYSRAPGDTIFFCEDEDTKAALIEAGAEEWSIYTRAELQVLVAHHRARPFIPDELLRLHAAKRTFGARIVK